ncbi:unnamed protein product, partial [Mesorhabditis spiculigera]
MLITLVNGYEVPDIASTCGSMLRECIRHDHLAKDLITKHKNLCAEFLDTNYDKFFGEYQKLLNSENYVSRRQSLKLLGELLLDRHNFNVMTRYISNPDNLKLMMNLLGEKSKSIQFELSTFSRIPKTSRKQLTHEYPQFQAFVANPNKPRPIADILLRNPKDKAHRLLSNSTTTGPRTSSSTTRRPTHQADPGDEGLACAPF